MYEIKITDVISHWWGISAKDVIKQLKSAKGQPVQLTINSPGGEVFEGLEIFNAIKNYEGGTTSVITGQATSMASSIAIAADRVIVEQMSAYMIHNPLGCVCGNYVDVGKYATLLEDIADLMAKEYSAKSGKSVADIRTLMDAETWYMGDSIQANGFADETRTSKNASKQGTESARVSAVASFEAMKVKIQNQNVTVENLQRIAAFLPKAEVKNITKKEKPNTGETKIMTLHDLKKDHPELVETIKAEACADERKRVNAHMKFIDSSKPLVVENIAKGVSIMDEEVFAGYLQNKMHGSFAVNAEDENVNGVTTDADATPPVVPEGDEQEIDPMMDASPENVKKFLNGEI